MINFDKVLAALRIQNIWQIRLFYYSNIISTLIFLLRVKIKIINNLRWYSRCSKLDALDQKSSEHVPIFLEKASKNLKISVFSYRDYKLKYDFLSEIKIN